MDTNSKLGVHRPAGRVRAFEKRGSENARLRREVARLEAERRRHAERQDELNSIGIALSAEKDLHALQNLILASCRQLTRADGASLWLVCQDESGSRLRFACTQSHSLDAVYHEFTIPIDDTSMAGYTVLSGRTQVVEDAYDLPPAAPYRHGRGFDREYGYRTRSVLAVPMPNHRGEIVGAIQLVNAKRDGATRLTPDNVAGEVVAFDAADQRLIESIASQAAVALDNRRLLDSIERLFEGFITASVAAVETRDPTTRGHSSRVAAMTVALAELITGIGTGEFKNVGFTADQLKELLYAGLLHDFGKLGVREHVLVKEKKLYFSQVELIKARFAFAERTLQLERAEERYRLAITGRATSEALEELDRRLAADVAEHHAWLEAIVAANEPTVLEEDKASVLAFLAERTYRDLDGSDRPLLDPREFHFLSIRKGTLDEGERREIESHVTHSFEFLRRIPWTPGLSGVPDIAYGHHEKLDGLGYPRGLKGDEIPLQARMMAIADIYDALAAHDRPYKKAVPRERALTILRSEAAEGKLDLRLLDVFITGRVYEAAAEAPAWA